MHKQIENGTLKLLALLVEAAFTRKDLKTRIIETARVQGEILKHLVRTENELMVIDERTYLRISKSLVEISKMINGWVVYTTKH